MGTRGARGSQKTRRAFEEGEFAHTIARMRATEISRRGLPAQIDADLTVLHHGLHTGQNWRGTIVNQILLDVFIFAGSGTWVEDSGRHTPVSCGHFVITSSLDNWHFCNKSDVWQDSCDPNDEGASVDFLLQFSAVTNWVAIVRGADSISSEVAKASASAARHFRFDTEWAKGNILSPSDMYLYSRSTSNAQLQWMTAPLTRDPADECILVQDKVPDGSCATIVDSSMCRQSLSCRLACARCPLRASSSV